MLHHSHLISQEDCNVVWRVAKEGVRVCTDFGGVYGWSVLPAEAKNAGMMKRCLLLSLALLLEQALSGSSIVTVDGNTWAEFSLPDKQPAQLMFWAEEPDVNFRLVYDKYRFSFRVREEHKWTAITFSAVSMQIPSYGYEIKFSEALSLIQRKASVMSEARIHWQLCPSVGTCALDPPAGSPPESSFSETLFNMEILLRSPLTSIILGTLCLILIATVLILAICICHLKRKLTNKLKEMQEYGTFDDVSHLASSQMTTFVSNKTSYFNFSSLRGDDSLPPYTAHPNNPINNTKNHHYPNEEPNQFESLQLEEPIYLNVQDRYVPTTDVGVYTNMQLNVAQQNKIRQSECDCLSLDSFD